jgi:hypothetical protein
VKEVTCVRAHGGRGRNEARASLAGFSSTSEMKRTVFIVALVGCLVWSGPPARAGEFPGPPAYEGFSEIPPAVTRFHLVGDTQSTSWVEFWRERNDRERKQLLEAMAQTAPAFAIHLGDLTTKGASEKQWEDFDGLHREFLDRRIPILPLLGNHEFYGSDEKALQNYFSRFPFLNGQRWYRFVWKRTGFLLLDSNFGKLSQEEAERQKRWYISELERFEADPAIDSVIVCTHHPPFTNSRVVAPSAEVRTSFAEPFTRYRKTVAFFSGHCHSYERFHHGGKHFIVSGGGGGPRHLLTTDPATRAWEDLFPGPALRFFHFCEVEDLDGKLFLRVRRLSDDGTLSVAELLQLSP